MPKEKAHPHGVWVVWRTPALPEDPATAFRWASGAAQTQLFRQEADGGERMPFGMAFDDIDELPLRLRGLASSHGIGGFLDAWTELADLRTLVRLCSLFFRAAYCM